MPTSLLGHSHGGWLALNTALHAPQRVGRLVLLAPAASLRPLVPRFYLQGIPAALLARRRLLTAFMDWMTADGFTVPSRFRAQFLLGMQGYRPQIKVWPTVYSDAELRRIDTPTLLLIGEEEVIYDPRAALERAERLIPDLAAELVPHAGHGLPMEQPERVNARVLGFLEREG